MELVVNEWLPEYLRGDADNFENNLAVRFLQRFINGNDVLIVKSPSPFIEKVYRYQKIFSGYPTATSNYSALISLIFRNQSKARIIYDNELLSLPEITLERLNTPGTNYHSDVYLFETAHISADRIIVTTDAALKRFMQADEHFNIILLEDFLRDYYF